MRAQIDRLTREKDAARKRMSERKEIIERKRTELIDRQRADLAAAEAAGKRELQAIDHRRSAAVHEHTRKLQGVRAVLGSKLAAVDSKFTELDRAETDALGDALLMVRERYFRDYLLSIELCSAEIPKIPGSMLRRLGSYGYKFVSDIDSNLTKVPGIGPVRAQALLDWRLTQEAAVRRASPSALPEDEERDVRAKYALERRKLEDERHQWKEELAWQEAQLGDQNRAVHVEMDKEEREIREGLKPKVAAIRLRFDQELSALDTEEARVIREHDQELRRLEEEILQMQSKLARVQHG